MTVSTSQTRITQKRTFHHVAQYGEPTQPLIYGSLYVVSRFQHFTNLKPLNPETERGKTMAARINKTEHADKTKRLIQASQLLNRLFSHAKGEVEMTASQVNAAKIVIGKAIPDLKAMELTGADGGPLELIAKWQDK